MPNSSLANSPFEAFFNAPNKDARRAKFLSRLLGLFSEELVRIWCRDKRAPYADLGRPTIVDDEAGKGYTLDFTFQERKTGRLFVAEMKCEIEYRGFRFLTLADPRQLDHHKKDAFTAFLHAAKLPKVRRVHIQQKDQEVDGAVLVWGAVSILGREQTIKEFGFADVLGLEDIMDDLKRWQSSELEGFIGHFAGWSDELFSFLTWSRSSKMTILEIKGDDEKFKNWRDSNPEGFIANLPDPNERDHREFYLPHVKLHSARCHTLQRNKNGEHPWTTNGYFKLCSSDIQEFERWFQANADLPPGWEVPRCKHKRCQKRFLSPSA